MDTSKGIPVWVLFDHAFVAIDELAGLNPFVVLRPEVGRSSLCWFFVFAKRPWSEVAVQLKQLPSSLDWHFEDGTADRDVCQRPVTVLEMD